MPNLVPDSNYLSALAVSETGFVFDPRTGHSFTVNRVGLTVLKKLRAGSPVNELVRELQQEFSGVASVPRDVADFVGMLREFGWVRALNGDQSP
jgi:Coenzyme PQQ synthesis protein D (PqqD)